MDIELTLKNYRCFADHKPARLRLRKGYTALIGINNSGKSSLLRFFYELRGIFTALSADQNRLHDILRGQTGSFEYPTTIQDVAEVFCNLNNRDMEFQLHFIRTEEDDFAGVS